jgi:L-lactate dehydrogenase complex protein LldF
VKINIHEQLLIWRRELAQQKLLPFSKRVAMTLTSAVFQRPWLYQWAGKLGRTALRLLPRFVVYNRLNPWGRQRELPPAPAQSFRERFKNRHVR